MIFWKKYHIKKYNTYEWKKRIYNDVIIAMDTETTTFFNVNGEWIVQDYDDDPDKYSQAEKRALVWIWQLSINDDVIYGREMADFFEFWERFAMINPHNSIVYIHNLGFDFSFFCEYLPFDTTVFAKAAYKPMYVRSKSLKIEWRCSYMLTNMSLDSCSKQYKLNVQKLSGTIAYNIARTPLTELTDDELNYCEFDVVVIYRLIKDVFLKRYKCIADIPLTQTGEVRREVKALLSNKWHLEKMKRISLNTVKEYRVATRLLQGGYTHLNFFYNGDVIENLDSFDKKSSYPDVMCTRKYPMSKFVPYHSYEKSDDYCYIMYVKILNPKSKGCWSYIARHKCEICYNGVCDNGKVNKADYIEIWVTDVDYDIIVSNYNYDDIELIECYRAYKTYLPKKFIMNVLKQFNDKTQLDGQPEFYAMYLQQKQKLNANYGMTVTSNIREEVTYSPYKQEWLEPEKLTDNDIAKQLSNDKPFLSYYWGILITAYARADLWSLISQIGIDCVYVDTDSLKIVNVEKHLPKIEQYNRECDERINTVCKALGIDKKLFYPVNPITGKIANLGHFEYELHYKKFKSLGSKKYCYIDDDDKLHVTVAGLKKSYIDKNGVHPTITSIDQFQEHTKNSKGKEGVIPNGRIIHWYLNDQKPTVLKDRDGVEYLATNTHGMAMLNTNYTFTISADYDEFLKDNKDLVMDARNQYTDYFRIVE